ncbi:TetR family transcriptional regulator [Brachybacterium endophyticum]|uniref:TetR family transcriptional regulator n=1 Tax=Brachybacterium endophyticum TaxID=2182385 RepID=A0A2U2RNP0_9MICO|nr:TetR/AcrR family transcriptional regulator [Brachybacterium endophyticum]PWH07497.1 TetR family transcriptional regulator [Brachybacterium endophyticum]
MSAREDVLDALEQILIRDGERAATLDAVAAQAGVSKGGLLYHFGSKKALVEGLADRMRERAALDAQQMAEAPDGPSIYYVRTSVFEDTPFDRTLVAATRLSGGDDAPVHAAFADVREGWLALIREEVGDAATAEAIMLIGDGLYYNAVLDPAFPSGDVGRESSMAGLLAVVERLREEARGA